MSGPHLKTRLASVALFAAVWAGGPARARGAEGRPVEIATAYTLDSAVLGESRVVNVYLPPGHEASRERYPVLFLLDGGVHEDFVHIAGIASLAADFRHIRPFVVVGIEGIDRYHDLTPPTSVARDRERLPTSGGSAAFREFLAEELLPWVDAELPVTGETVLMGESVAGLFVAETLLLQPELFQGYVAVDPSLWWDAGALASRAAERLDADDFPGDRRLYLATSADALEMREPVEALLAALRDRAPATLDWTYRPMPEETHGTIFHPAALAAVRLLFAAQAPE